MGKCVVCNNQKPWNTVVLKANMHRDHNADKIINSLRKFHGVDDVKPEWGLSTLTITGVVDPSKLCDELAKRTKKDVTLVSSKELPGTTVILKIKMHCNGCFVKIHKVINDFKGVYTFACDRENELFTVVGVMDVPKLQDKLKKRVKTTADIVQPKDDQNKEQPKDDQYKEQPKFDYSTYGREYMQCRMFSENNPNACSIM